MINNDSKGTVAEWLKALVLKTRDGKTSVGSNPTGSARADNLPQLISAYQKSCTCFRGVKVTWLIVNQQLRVRLPFGSA